MKKRDEVFKKERERVEAFRFNEDVAEVFDDMVSRSIPFYDEIHRILLDIVERRYLHRGTIYDLGCSTGTTIRLLSLHLEKRGIEADFVGVDTSKPMLKKAKEKLHQIHVPKLELRCEDISQTDISNAELVIMNYTLQFIPPEKRLPLLRRINHNLIPGGTFLLAEKLHASDESIDELLTELYYDFKRRNGYSELEISQKREALENVLIPLTPKEQMQELREAGFKKCEMLFRWYNFACYIAIK